MMKNYEMMQLAGLLANMTPNMRNLAPSLLNMGYQQQQSAQTKADQLVAAQKVQSLLGQAPSISQFQPDTFPGENPVMLSGQNTQNMATVTPGSGYLGNGNVNQLAAGLLGVPGYEKTGLGLLATSMKNQGGAFSGTGWTNQAANKLIELQNKYRTTGSLTNPEKSTIGFITANLTKPMTVTDAQGNVTQMPGMNLAPFSDVINYSGVSKQSGTQTTKPLGTQASNWMNDKGDTPDPAMSAPQASSAGFKPMNTTNIQNMQAAKMAGPIFGSMMKYGFGSGNQKSLFPSKDVSMGGRAVDAARSWLSGVTDSDLRISLYNSSKDAIVAGLARLAGNVGTLTDRDVATVKGLLPVAGMTPDPIAKEKFKQIGVLLMGKGVTKDMLSQMGFPSWALDGSGSSNVPAPPPGYK